jgi:hypothetical protein
MSSSEMINEQLTGKKEVKGGGVAKLRAKSRKFTTGTEDNKASYPRFETETPRSEMTVVTLREKLFGIPLYECFKGLL